MVTLHADRRIRILLIASFLLFVALGARLFDLQVLRGGHFTAVAQAQRKRASELVPSRGTIYFTEGASDEIFPIASNKRAWISYAVPAEMEHPEDVARQLAGALRAFREREQGRVVGTIQETGQLTGEEYTPVEPPSEDDIRAQLEEKFRQRSDPYEPFLRPYEVLDDEFRGYLEQQNLEGIHLEEQQVRVYPEGSLAAHLLGYVGFEEDRRSGKYGVEGYYDEELRGDFGWLSLERDTAGRFIGVGSSQLDPAQDGSDIVLSIDRVVQSYVEEEVKDGVERYGARRGSITVMEPTTGAILGMATYPTFDPNSYYAIRDARVQLNPVVSDIFEPGSILKPIVMAGAIDLGLVEPDTTFTDSGPVRVAEYTIDTFDSRHWGLQTMTQVLEQSNNVGMVWVAQQMGAQNMYDYFRRFGLGERTGIELEGETQTNLPTPEEWNVTTVATAGFGQGVAITPLQALDGINAIANKGVLMQPYVVSSIRKSDGTVVDTQPTPVRSVVSQEAAGKVSAMMVSVIENGVAGLARVPGYYLAGKTGTAQVPDERGKYSKDEKIISFVGFGPVENPKFSILIKLDNPSGLSFASGTAAPMFGNLAEKLLNYYQIPPSYDDSVQQPTYRVSP